MKTPVRSALAATVAVGLCFAAVVHVSAPSAALAGDYRPKESDVRAICRYAENNWEPPGRSRAARAWSYRRCVEITRTTPPAE
jgi:hypothetical protein